MAKNRVRSIRFDNETEDLFNKFKVKASKPFFEKGENLPTAHLIQELVKAQLKNIIHDGGTTIRGKVIST